MKHDPVKTKNTLSKYNQVIKKNKELSLQIKSLEEFKSFLLSENKTNKDRINNLEAHILTIKNSHSGLDKSMADITKKISEICNKKPWHKRIF